MPTFTFDITDEVSNIVDMAIKEGGPSDFNPGQEVAWAAVTCDISAAAIVRIAGPDVDVTTDISVKCSGAEYISEAVEGLEGLGEMLGKSIEQGNYFLHDDLVEQAFDKL